MLLVPLEVEGEEIRPGIVSVVIGGLIIYQTIILYFAPSMGISVERLQDFSLTDPGDYWLFFLGLFRGAGPFSSLFLLCFWVVLGQGLQSRSGPWVLAVTYLAGAIAPFMLSGFGWIALERSFWPGIGGTMACMGLAYYYIWDFEVRFLYFAITPPMGFRTGVSTMICVVLLLFMHIVLCLAQIIMYRERDVPPHGLQTFAWLFALPFVIFVLCHVCRRIAAPFAPLRKKARAA
ncbi:hypothetical protein BH09SUM1_BH09SUM1_30160 [soil metagenome]